MSAESEDDYIDPMIDAGEEYMHRRAKGAGLDAELVSLSGMTVEERGALEWFALYTTDIDPTERQSVKRAILRVLQTTVHLQQTIGELRSDAAAARAQSRGATRAVVLLGAIALFILAVVSFRSDIITVDPNDGSVFHISKSWWGLSHDEREIRWMQPAGFGFSCWAAQNGSGRWYCFIEEP
jgi:hypothetical protein